MSTVRKAKWTEKLRLILYKYYYIWCFLVALLLSIIAWQCELMETLVDNAATLSDIGVGIASVLFAVQGITLAIPAENPFMKMIRQDGHYFIFLNRFCRSAELVFLLLLTPMLFMSKESTYLNLAVMSAYIFALLLTLWIMWLMGEIIITGERHTRK